MRKTQHNFNDFISSNYDGSAKSVTFQVTEDCNLTCSYCYQICKSKHKMDFATAKAFIDKLFEMDECGNEWVNDKEAFAIILEFIGGEPFLEVELMDAICDYFANCAIEKRHRWALHHKIGISTNGMLYFDEKVQAFISKYLPRLSMSITLDGHKALHDACRLDHNGNGSYDTVVAACRHYMQNYGFLSTKITLAPENVGEFYDAFKHMVELGFTEINANVVFEDVWDNAVHPMILYEQMVKIANYVIDNNLQDSLACSLFDANAGGAPSEDNYCGGTGKMLALDYQGLVYPCIRYMRSSLGDDVPPIIIGDTETGVGVCGPHREVMQMLDGITRRSQQDDECYYCEIAGGCAWCSAYNYQVTGTPNKHIKTICGMHKARVAGIAYYEGRLCAKNL